MLLTTGGWTVGEKMGRNSKYSAAIGTWESATDYRSETDFTYFFSPEIMKN